MFRDFKRHYHKTRSVYEEMAQTGNFSLNISFSDNNVQAEMATPNSELTMRFIVLVRRFLDKSDPICCLTVWAKCQEKFNTVIPEGSKAQIHNILDSMRKGRVGITINEERVTPEGIYETISDGHLFKSDSAIEEHLQKLMSVPLAGPLLWNEFYQYSFEGLVLTSLLFDVIVVIESAPDYQIEFPEQTFTNKCIYCLSDSKTFTSEEHVFPESLGNDQLVLPLGYVCDQCNNEILSSLDDYLLKFEPIAFLQVYFVPYTKKGKLPKANFQNVLFEKTGPRAIRFSAKDKTGNMKDVRDLGSGWKSFSFTVKGKKLDVTKLAQALCKIALGLIALSEGVEAATSKRFDATRKFIATGNGISNSLLICLHSTPKPYCEAQYNPELPGCIFAIGIYGLTFLVNLVSEPKLELNDDLREAKMAIFSYGT